MVDFSLFFFGFTEASHGVSGGDDTDTTPDSDTDIDNDGIFTN